VLAVGHIARSVPRLELETKMRRPVGFALTVPPDRSVPNAVCEIDNAVVSLIQYPCAARPEQGRPPPRVPVIQNEAQAAMLVLEIDGARSVLIGWKARHGPSFHGRTVRKRDMGRVALASAGWKRIRAAEGSFSPVVRYSQTSAAAGPGNRFAASRAEPLAEESAAAFARDGGG